MTIQEWVNERERGWIMNGRRQEMPTHLEEGPVITENEPTTGKVGWYVVGYGTQGEGGGK